MFGCGAVRDLTNSFPGKYSLWVAVKPAMSTVRLSKIGTSRKQINAITKRTQFDVARVRVGFYFNIKKIRLLGRSG